MSQEAIPCPTTEQLWSQVHQYLCQQAVLEPAQVPLKTELLYRRGRPCGVLFHIEGPRQIRPSAIWVAGEQRLILYDSQGHRTREVHLQPAPPESVLATLAEQTPRVSLANRCAA